MKNKTSFMWVSLGNGENRKKPSHVTGKMFELTVIILYGHLVNCRDNNVVVDLI